MSCNAIDSFNAVDKIDLPLGKAAEIGATRHWFGNLTIAMNEMSTHIYIG